MGTRLHSAERVAASSTLPTWYEDDYLSGADLGAEMFDLSRPLSYPKQGAPANGDVVKDVLDASFESPATPLAAGSVILQSGQAIAFDGARFDFSNLTYASNVLSPNGLRMPARVMSQIRGDGTVPQYFLMWCWMVLPTAADYNPANGNAVTFMASNEVQNGEDTAALARIAMVNTPLTAGPGLMLRRQRFTGTGTGSGHQLNLLLPTASLGQKALVAGWRTSAGCTLYCRTAAGGVAHQSSNAGNPDGADNTADFSACPLDFGVLVPGTPVLGPGGAPNAKKFKIGKGGYEALRITGRDPETVINAEWAREVARGVHG